MFDMSTKCNLKLAYPLSHMKFQLFYNPLPQTDGLKLSLWNITVPWQRLTILVLQTGTFTSGKLVLHLFFPDFSEVETLVTQRGWSNFVIGSLHFKMFTVWLPLMLRGKIKMMAYAVLCVLPWTILCSLICKSSSFPENKQFWGENTACSAHLWWLMFSYLPRKFAQFFTMGFFLMA